MLVLEGHPSATIAKRLGIGRGTVKNHRRRLYDKLDITTERELFLRYLEWLAQSDPAAQRSFEAGRIRAMTEPERVVREMAGQMRAIVANGTGGAEVLELRQVPLTWPRGGHDVLVRLKAASLNPADIYFRSYGPYIKNAAPILGHDGAGVVEEVGGEVARFRPGDRVCFCNGGIGGDPGTYAEFAVVPEEQLVPRAEQRRLDCGGRAAAGDDHGVGGAL